MSLEKTEIKKAVREQYGAVARGETQSCCAPTCCTPTEFNPQDSIQIGYTKEALESLPSGADLGLGCGNPSAFATLKAGETVLDLGSGGGIDAFVAARAVGPTGQVIGVDMTSDMIERARSNASKAGLGNVEFRLGEIENLPVADNSVDCIMSNCVVNLSPDKPRVFAEAYRVLKPGGRLAISDVLAEKDLPPELIESIAAYVGCVAGAATIDQTIQMLNNAGFSSVEVTREEASKAFIKDWIPGAGLDEYAVSAKIQAVK